MGQAYQIEVGRHYLLVDNSALGVTFDSEWRDRAANGSRDDLVHPHSQTDRCSSAGRLPSPGG